MNKDYLYFRGLYRDELYHHGVKGQKWGVINKANNNPITRTARKNKAEIGATLGGAAAGAGTAWLATLGSAAATQAFLAYKMSKESNSVADVIRLAHKGQTAMNAIGKVAYPIAVTSLATAGGLIGYNIAKKRSSNKSSQQK